MSNPLWLTLWLQKADSPAEILWAFFPGKGALRKYGEDF